MSSISDGSGSCANCGAPRPTLPIWTFAVPIIIGAASLGLILVFKGRIPGRILAGAVTLAFLGFAAWLAMKMKAVLSAACPKCGVKTG